MRIPALLSMIIVCTSFLTAQQVAEIGPHLEFLIERVGAEGLSQGMINGIAEDQQGYLWIATKDGLNRYDGTSFKIYRHERDNPHSVAENFIQSVFVDSRNLVWVGTNSKGLDLFDRNTGRFVHFGTQNQTKESSRLKTITKILEDGFGNIIIQGDQQDIVEVLKPIHQPNAKSDFTFHLITFDEVYPVVHHTPFHFNPAGIIGFGIDSTVWYTDKQEIYALHPNTFTIIPKPGAHQIRQSHMEANDGINLFFNQGYQNLFVIDTTNLIQQYDDALNRFIPFLKVPEEFEINNHLLFTDQLNRLWVNQGNGQMLRIDLTSKIISQISIIWDNAEQQRNQKFKLCLQDIHQNIWARTSGHGLLKISARNDLFIKIPSTEGITYGIRVDHNGTSAAQYKPPFQWQFFRDTLATAAGIKLADFTFHIAVDKNGFYWLPTLNENKEEGYLTRIHPTEKSYEIMATATYQESEWFASSIFSDRFGEIWFGERCHQNSARLFHLNEETGTYEKFNFPITTINNAHRFISDWYITPGNLFWLGTKQGLFSFQPKTGEWTHFQNILSDTLSLSSNSILSVCPDPGQPDRYLWVGTDGGGLNRFDYQSQTFICYTTKDGLPNNTIYAIQSDYKNNLWMSTNNGLCLFNPSTLSIQNFTSKDGLPGNEFNRYTYYKTSEGKLCFSGVNGTIIFNPKDFYDDHEPSKIVINTLKLKNEIVEYNDNQANNKKFTFPLSAPIELCPEIILPYNERMISFGFAVLDLTNPQGNLYKYMMEGFNEDWIDGGNSPEATYTNLAPGKYTFKVIGSNSMNKWSARPAEIAVTILPPWWGTWWFRLLILCIVTFSIYSFYRYRLQQSIKLQAIRNRIAADLHDEIGSTLSSISLASSVIQKKVSANTPEVNTLLHQISHNTDNMMEAMSDIVWAVNTKNDRFDNVIQRMRAFSVEILEPKDILVHFDAAPNTHHLQLNMEKRKNLYLIFKEIINNSAKYSGGKNVWVSISLSGGRLQMIIRDDGRGFTHHFHSQMNMPTSESPPIFGGNGLNNIRKRIDELKGTLSINSAPGTGTTIEVSFAL